MKFSPAAALAICSTFSFVIAAPFVRVDKRSELPAAWKRIPSSVGRDEVIPMRIGLTQQNLDQIDHQLSLVSNPDSDQFAQHWTPSQIAEYFQPKKETVEAVLEWLHSEGIDLKRTSMSKSKTWLKVDLKVHEAEKLLDAKYEKFMHHTGVEKLVCDSYAVPAHVRQHIELITPTVDFDHPDGHPRPSENTRVEKRAVSPTAAVKPGVAHSVGQPSNNKGPKVAPAGFTGGLKNVINELKNCANVTTLDCLRVLYKITYLPKNLVSNAYAVVEYTPQAYVPSDLDMFFKNYSSQQIGNRPITHLIDGAVVQQTDMSFDTNGESNLDLQYAMGLAYPINVTLYQVGDLVQGASFNNLLDAIDGSYCTYEGGDDPTQDGIYPASENCGVAPLTKVISTSYGYNEADLTPFYEMRQCNEYAKLGLMGVTILYSSGDYGVAGNGGDCINPTTGLYSQGPDGVTFNPSFPSTCPYVTSVGATQIKPGGSVLQAEEACETVIYSGGGFSNVFPIPSYQKSAVASYFKSHKPPYTSTQYNNSMTVRGYPDVSANGANYVVAIDGQFGLVYGTSASSPVFGSIIALINDARAQVGKKSVGFINPTIYSSLATFAFTDITSGGNQGCMTPGFTAVPGWDPVTGLGTPNFPGMLALWLALP